MIKRLIEMMPVTTTILVVFGILYFVQGCGS